MNHRVAENGVLGHQRARFLPKAVELFTGNGNSSQLSMKTRSSGSSEPGSVIKTLPTAPRKLPNYSVVILQAVIAGNLVVTAKTQMKTLRNHLSFVLNKQISYIVLINEL